MLDLGGVHDRADFNRRLAVTAIALIVYRLGAQIPLPGVNLEALAKLDGLALERVSILALGVNPLVTVLILAELVKVLVPACRRWERADPRNRDQLNRIVLSLGLLATAAQASGLAIALEGVTGLVDAPGTGFRLPTVATLVAGTAIAMWLADQITRRGIGSGVWLLFLTPTLADLPHRIGALAAWQGDASLLATDVLIAMAFAALVFAAIGGLIRADGSSLATAATCLWSVLIATAAWPWVMFGLILLADALSPAGLALAGGGKHWTWLRPGGEISLVLLAGLRALFVPLYVRSQRIGGATTFSLIPPALLAGTLATITLANFAIPTLSAHLAPQTGPLVVMAVVALSILDRWWTPPRAAGTSAG
jgi:SecY